MGGALLSYPMGNNPGPINAMFVDLNSIPQAAIESIEILKDGASTTYGADAVAGVVNLKMRHYYDGAEATFNTATPPTTTRRVAFASLIFGVGNKDTEIAGVLQFLSSQLHRQSRPQLFGGSALPELEREPV